MDLQTFLDKAKSGELIVPAINEWKKVKWTVIKRIEKWVLVDCQEGAFTWIILPKEAKNLERNWIDISEWVELEAEIVNLTTRDEEGYFVISISKLLQYDIWKKIVSNVQKDEVMTVTPTEANLWWLLIDMHWIKWFIPLSQLAPVNYPRVEDGDQEKIFEQLLQLIWKEFKVRVINVDEEGKRLIFSERDALKEEREQIMEELDIGKEYDWVVSGISSYWLFVTIGWGIEWLVHVSEITYWHVDSIERFWKTWDKVRVKVIWYEDGKISLSIKKLKEDPWSIIPKKLKIWDVVEWEVIRYVPYGVFIRVFDDINWLVHLSEITSKQVANPADAVKLWQKVKAKIIFMDPSKRKMWLSIKALEGWTKQTKTTVTKKSDKSEKSEKSEKTTKPSSKATSSKWKTTKSESTKSEEKKSS